MYLTVQVFVLNKEWPREGTLQRLFAPHKPTFLQAPILPNKILNSGDPYAYLASLSGARFSLLVYLKGKDSLEWETAIKQRRKQTGEGKREKDKLMGATSSGNLERSEMIIIIFYKILRNVTVNHHLS